MSDLSQPIIKGVQYDFWARTGTVSGVVQKSETQVWSSGGGGYIDPQFGGVVHAPTVHSHTSHWKEVRIDGDDGKPYTVTLQDGITAFPGDRASVIYGKPLSHETGFAHGFKNHREERWWSFNCERMVKPEYRQSLSGLIFRLCSKGLLSFLGGLVLTSIVLRVIQWPFMILNPIGLIFETVYHFQYEWPIIGIVTIVAGFLVRWTYRWQRSSSAKKASKAILNFAADIEDPQTAAARVIEAEAKPSLARPAA